MDAIISFIGVILRFPFFVLGFLFWGVVIVPFAIVYSICLFALTPLKLLGCAFSNDKVGFREYVDSVFDFSETRYVLKKLWLWLLHA